MGAAVAAWLEAYVRAWESNDPGDIGELFAPGARYFTAPHRPPWEGRDAIVTGWLERRDEPGTWRFEHRPPAVCDGTAFVRGVTVYDDATYGNLWQVTLDDGGRCTEFVEWWMEHGGD